MADNRLRIDEATSNDLRKLSTETGVEVKTLLNEMIKHQYRKNEFEKFSETEKASINKLFKHFDILQDLILTSFKEKETIKEVTRKENKEELEEKDEQIRVLSTSLDKAQKELLNCKNESIEKSDKIISLEQVIKEREEEINFLKTKLNSEKNIAKEFSDLKNMVQELSKIKTQKNEEGEQKNERSINKL